MSRGSFRSVGKKPGVDCCNGAPRGMSRGSVRSHEKSLEPDCCNGAPRDMSRGSFRSAKRKPGVLLGRPSVLGHIERNQSSIAG